MIRTLKLRKKQVRELHPEGRVFFNIDDTIKIHNDNSYELSLPLIYLEPMIYSRELKMKGSIDRLKEYQTMSNILVEIKKLMSESEIRKCNFKDINGHADVVTYIDMFGNKFSELENVELYRETDKDTIEEKIEKFIDNLMYREAVIPKFIFKDKLDIDEILGLKNQNRKLLLDEFYGDGIREDHYAEKGRMILRLAAIFKLSNRSKKDIKDAMKKIINLPIRPRAVYIDDDIFTLEFSSSREFHFKSKSDYLNLMIDFVEYINSINELELHLSMGMFLDDTQVISKDAPILDNIKFTSELFSNNTTEFYGNILNRETCYRI